MLNKGRDNSGQTETFMLEKIRADMKQVFTLRLELCRLYFLVIVICGLPLTTLLFHNQSNV